MDENLEKAYLSWTIADYEKSGEKIPDILINNPGKTEGELMSDEDIVNWIMDTNKTFCIIKEKDDKAFKKLYSEYLLDVEYLANIGRLDQDTADDLLNIDNFEF